MKTNQLTDRRTDWESFALPLVLMLTGFVLIVGNWLGVLSLDRVQHLWPGAIIVIGLAELMPKYGNASPNRAFIQRDNQNRHAQ